MNEFSFDRAWSRGMEFITRRAGNHAIILIGLGVVAPLVLQYALIGTASTVNPTMLGQAGPAAALAGGGAIVLVMLVSYILQTGSYFASWRNGLAGHESLGGAIAYGLLAGVVVIVACIVLFIVLGGVIGLISTGLAGFLVVIALLPVFAILYTLLASLVAVLGFLLFLLILAFGVSLGGMNAALAMTGEGTAGIVIALLLLLVLLWLSARLSCTTSVMADRRTVNVFAGMSESWRLTAVGQWRIMAYLALISIVLGVVFIVIGIVVGASMVGSMRAGEMPEPGVGMILFTLVVSIGLAYLTVLVPAGIYRTLAAENRADVFA